MIKAVWSKLTSKLLTRVTEANQRQWTLVYAVAMLLVSGWLLLQLYWLKQANQRFAEVTSQRLNLVQVVVDYLNGRQSLERLSNRQALSQAWPTATERQAQLERLISELKLAIKVNSTVGPVGPAANTSAAKSETTIQLAGPQSELWQLVSALTTRPELPGILSFEIQTGPVANQEQLTLRWRLGQLPESSQDKNEKL